MKDDRQLGRAVIESFREENAVPSSSVALILVAEGSGLLEGRRRRRRLGWAREDGWADRISEGESVLPESGAIGSGKEDQGGRG